MKLTVSYFNHWTNSRMAVDERKERRKAKPAQNDLNPLAVDAALVEHSLGCKWYDYSSEECAKILSDANDVSHAEMQAELLLQRDIALYNKALDEKSTERLWLNKMITGGTAADRISAMQVFIQRSPVHALSKIEALVSIVAKKYTREAFALLSTLKDIFINELLPPKRKLIPFSARPIDQNMDVSRVNDRTYERKLVIWKFESDLKLLYGRFVDAIERLASGNVEKLSAKACKTALELLIECPELEQRLLSLLVNKLGHPNKALAAKVCGYLLQLTEKEPLMKGIIVKEVERLIYRKNVSCSAQLHAVSFLSQINLYGTDPSVAASLLNIYIGLFRILVSAKQFDNKLLSALLFATNRAFPYAKGEASKLNEELNTLYKVLHNCSFAASLQTLKLLYQLHTTSVNVTDRFFSALYRKLFNYTQSASDGKQLLMLLYQVLKNDTVERRVLAFIKRLLQLALARNAAFAAASLLLVSRLVDDRPSLLITKRSTNSEALMHVFKKGEPASDCADDEQFADVESTEKVMKVAGAEAKKCCVTIKETENDKKDDVRAVKAAGWVHKDNIAIRNDLMSYEPTARNPLFARADLSIATELTLLSNHYHPSVAFFATNLLTGASNRYDGDPLVDFTLIRFLDRFVFRNPRIKNNSKGNTKNARKRAYDPRGIKRLAVTSEEYVSKNLNEIPADERFLHRFTAMKFKQKKESEEESYVDDDAESVDSDEFDLLLQRFEPGESREAFDVDFAKELRAEKATYSKKERKRRRAEEHFDSDANSEDDVVDEDDLADEEDELNGSGEDFEDDDDDDADYNEDDESNDEEMIMKGSGMDDDDDDEDNENFAGKLNFTDDAALSADKLEVMMEDKKDMKRKKNKKLKGFKKRRKH